MPYDIRNNEIWFIEESVQGAWVIHGNRGTRQYMGYTKREAKEEYLRSPEVTITNRKKVSQR